ncbi:MAG: hypothetical protein HQL06_15610 [Nitrospirae bacterium]|nr:hypothetical protein [Nitrospirota bacterium]
MSTVAIPGWNHQGILPPIIDINTVTRSPYAVLFTDFVLRFGTTPKRQTILSGFMSFRAQLHAAGLVKGFQWINGSFLENIEMIENRDPADVDVVTFFYLPPNKTQKDLNEAYPRLFNPVHTKDDYHVDAYFVQLNVDTPETLVQLSSYWYSMWSHRRNCQWKGYLQIDLSQIDDSKTTISLDKTRDQRGQP